MAAAVADLEDIVTDTAERYPLSWPAGWVRRPRSARARARFNRLERFYGTDGQYSGTEKRALSTADAIRRLTQEVDRLGGRDVILSTNVPTRLDGMPRTDRKEPVDPGVALYFRLKGQPRVLACDTWDRVADNIAAIAAHIVAIRSIDRYGVGTLEQAFAGYARLTTGAEPWWTVLGVNEDASPDQYEDAYRLLAKRHHPDAGGDPHVMTRINGAIATARALRGRGRPWP
jgi:hypothetical protein